jgi:Xaa-Pro dipeptidase
MQTLDWNTDWSNSVFSLAERDSRWARVRHLMNTAGVDVIVALPCTHSHDKGAADARYLTQLGENAEEQTVVFAASGEVMAWHSRGGVWPSSNWLGEVRATRRGTGGAAAVDYLQETGLSPGRIAITGLTSSLLAHVRAIEGETNWQSVEIIKAAFPDAEVVSATPILGQARYVKSAEEIDFLRRATQVAEISDSAVRAALAEGVPERLIFGELLRANAVAGGSFCPMIGWISGPFGDTYHRVEQPTFRSVQLGDVISLEIEGRWGGYISQIDQTYYVGDAPPVLRDGTKFCIDVFWDVFNALRPGVTIGELHKLAQQTALGGRARSQLVIHGRGTGDDGPLLTTSITDEMLRLVVEENCCFAVKPSVWIDGLSDMGHWGESVAVTPTGAERLGSRDPDLFEVK